ncbi:D(2) dopamine receptor [Drosophila rhopaloa]|uniref:G-protein coupled receptors family 1 profile domain-containing protein n=1 Tax=Drosophila rhopaloa TaxID=1041015 RepID=A0ABM5J7M5_DRORH|nr:D(2) dopamine receptor [Drosophila rhopaloa]
MAINLQLNNLSAIYPSLMYVAASSLRGLGSGQPENISIVYEDAANGTGGVVPGANGTAGGSDAVPLTEPGPTQPVTTFNYYNESAAAAEWEHFYDLVLSWQGIILIAVFATFIVVTVIGNTLVILAILTTRRLRTITNCFVMSLAVADLLVGIFVMPPAVAVHLTGSWQLGWVLCDIWISLDVLLCTASILSLCAISVDRYLAVTRPLTYSRKRRSKRLALIMILIVWLLALAITCPPILGWYEPGRRDLRECRYNQNEGYVIFSAMGSFFIPMAVMIYVYARISCVIASRHDNMTDISVHNKKFKRYTAADVENELSEQEQHSSVGHRQRQATSRTFSNQTIAKELHDMMLSDSDNCAPVGAGGGGGGGGGGAAASATTHCQSLLALPSSGVCAKNGCYELTRPSSLKRTSTASTTITTMTSGMGPGSGLLDAQWQSQPPGHNQAQSQIQTQTHSLSQPPRPHSFRHSHGDRDRERLRSHHHHPHYHHQAGVTATTTSGNASANTNSKSLSNRITSLKKENKTTQTLSIVVGGFIACWLPFFINYLITPFLAEHQASQMLAKALTWLGWFNSAINPFIYAFYSVDFRAAFWRLTCKRFFSAGQKPQFPTNTMSIRR